MSDDLTPETFDLAEWLGGIAPATAVYPLDGHEIPMRARTTDWIEETRKQAEADKLTPHEQDVTFLHGHIADERVTLDVVKHLAEVRPAEFRAMVALAIDLDTKPRAQISPRFLPAASD